MSVLSGIKVLDMTRVIAGPTATQCLGDFGADVIKVERPGEGDDVRHVGPPWLIDYNGEETRESTYFQAANRNKRSIAVNFQTEEGAALLRELAGKADIFVENFRPNTLAKYGLDYQSLKQSNPGLIYCSISGFGQTGPYSTRSGYDFLMQAMSGLMSVTGEPDGPPMRVGVPIADILAGKDAVIGILLALRYREQTGQGQCIDISLFESQVAAMANTFTAWFNGRFEMPRTANDHPSASPYGVYRTSDGYLLIATFNNREFARLATAVGRPDWMQNPHYNSMGARVAHRRELASALTEILVKNTREYWINLLNPAGVSCGPINRMADLERDPHFIARGIEVKLPHALSGEIAVAASPIRCSESAAEYRLGPPVIGQHTAEVLHEVLGMDESAVKRLAENGVL
jgi:crotonobetainyl-CoA:carnitine CoA-transferase CaiB-like acyl-CoA transferase